MSRNDSIPNIVAETFMTTFKCFVVIIIINNLIWAVVHFSQPAPTNGGNRVEITQTGNESIHQNINN